MDEIAEKTKIEFITFVNGVSCSYGSTVGEALKEINHYQAFWISSVGNQYSTSQLDVKRPRAVIKIIKGFSPEIREWLSKRMRCIMTTTGTNVFETQTDAVLYYGKQGICRADVIEKIRNGEISIGQHVFDKLYPVEEYYIDRDGRYHIRDY